MTMSKALITKYRVRIKRAQASIKLNEKKIAKLTPSKAAGK
jgi:hypothetical protein